MKQLSETTIFKNLLFKWLLLFISLITSIHTIYEIITQEKTITLLFSVTILFISILTIISILLKNKNAEQLTLYFIVINLILVNVSIEFVNFLYSIQPNSEMSNFFGIENLITLTYIAVGLILLTMFNGILGDGNSKKIKLYGNLYILVGVFCFFRLPILNYMFNKIEFYGIVGYSFTTFSLLLLKTIFAFLIVSFGYLLNKRKFKLKAATILTILVLIIYGLI